MGTGPSMSRPPRHPVPNGKTRICVAGFKMSPFTGRSRALAGAIAKSFPESYESWFYFDSSNEYYAFLKEMFDPVPFPPHLKGHSSSPFVWLERGPQNEITPIGGNEHFCKWVLSQPELCGNDNIKELASTSWKFSEVCHNSASDACQSTANVTP